MYMYVHKHNIFMGLDLINTVSMMHVRPKKGQNFRYDSGFLSASHCTVFKIHNSMASCITVLKSANINTAETLV